jgi:lambda repressor-like predicted transcriptional regulator
MTVEEYRIMLGWSKQQLADAAGIDITTLYNALDPQKRIYKATASKIANAISAELQRRGQTPIRYTDLAGLTFAD